MNKKINITDIPKENKYIGYLWMSDGENGLLDGNNKKILAPKVYSSSTILDEELNISDNDNPFIIEGQLYNDKEKKSYSIKYVDGKHIVVEYDLNKIPNDWVCDEEDVKKFIPNRLERISKIVFKQFWKPESALDNELNEDDLCLGMPVLVPAAFVFVGFEYNKEKEDK